MERTQEFTVGPDVLWRAVTDPDELASWLGEEVAFEPAPGAIGHVVDDEGLKRLIVDEVDEGHRVRFTWWPEGDGEPLAPPSQVEFIVEPAPSGSRLLVREHRAASGPWTISLCALQTRLRASASASV